MGSYQRLTASPARTALVEAEDFLRARIPIEKIASDDHSVTLRGDDGTAVIEAHAHGPDTTVVVTTDQVRTSRLDIEVQHYMSALPYEPGDSPIP